MKEKRKLSDVFYNVFYIVGTLILFAMNASEGIKETADKVWNEVYIFIAMLPWMVIAFSKINKFLKKKSLGFPSGIALIGVASMLISVLFLAIEAGLWTFLLHFSMREFISEGFGALMLKLLGELGGFASVIRRMAYCLVMMGIMYLANRMHFKDKLVLSMGFIEEENMAFIADSKLNLPFEYDGGNGKLYKNNEECLILFKNGKAEKAGAKAEFLSNIEPCGDNLFAVEDASFVPNELYYQVREEKDWYELVPIGPSVEQEEEDAERKGISLNAIILWTIVPVAIFIILSYFLAVMCRDGVHMMGEPFFAWTKYISYASLMLTVSSLMNFVIAPEEKTTSGMQILACSISSVVVLVLVLLINSGYHFLQYYYQFGLEDVVPYINFIKEDILYYYGWGFLRFPAVLVMYLGMYFLQRFYIFKKNGLGDDDE